MTWQRKRVGSTFRDGEPSPSPLPSSAPAVVFARNAESSANVAAWCATVGPGPSGWLRAAPSKLVSLVNTTGQRRDRPRDLLSLQTHPRDDLSLRVVVRCRCRSTPAWTRCAPATSRGKTDRGLLVVDGPPHGERAHAEWRERGRCAAPFRACPAAAVVADAAHRSRGQRVPYLFYEYAIERAAAGLEASVRPDLA